MKTFGDEAVESGLASVVSIFDSIPSEPIRCQLQNFTENFPNLLASIDETYGQLEDRANTAQRTLEVSADELTQANSRLFRMNQTFDAMLNCLGQGFLLVGRDGICLDVYSKACENLLEVAPAGKRFAEVMAVPAEKREVFREWLELLFQDVLDFEEFCKLGPSSFNHSKGKKISIEYRPVRDPNGDIELILAIATDLTKEFEANKKAEEMQAYAALVVSILKNKEQFRQFVFNFRQLMTECAMSLAGPSFQEQEVAKIKRDLHGLKGASGTFGMLKVQQKIHEIESGIAGAETPKNVLEYLGSKISLLNNMFESILRENSDVLGDLLGTEGPMRSVSVSKLREFEEILSSGAWDQEAFKTKLVNEIIAVPCSVLFERYNIVLQKTAQILGKRIRKISFHGRGVSLIPEDYTDLLENISHVFRNIADHGIEKSEIRLAAGKSDEGNVTVEIHEPGNAKYLEIRISDDGAGIDIERLRAKLKAMGNLDLANSSTEDKILDGVFLPGVTTAQALTESSGRGIGLDSVRASVLRLGGSISVSSKPGRGTSFLLRIPRMK
ncbi:MAG: ATP-binding protein [Bdellovibrionota bacterium]